MSTISAFRNENHTKIDNQNRDFQYPKKLLAASVLHRTAPGISVGVNKRNMEKDCICSAPYCFFLSAVHVDATGGLCCAVTAANAEFCL